jgi:hypothetical protein
MTVGRLNYEPSQSVFRALWVIVLLIPGMIPLFSVVAANGAERVAGKVESAPRDATFDDVKLDLKKDEPFKKTSLTTKVKDLEGKWIKIRGYILPGFQDTGIKQFVLTRDNMECCFGKGAALHDCILVEMLDDATTNFTVRPVTVIGKFTVKEVVDADGKQLAIYRLDARETK